MSRPDSKENFIKAVYLLQQDSPHERVSTNALADALEITAPSVTDMARRVAADGLLDYVKHYGVKLTEQGQQAALRVIRRHRLIETYLVRELGYALHEVHAEAEELEHVVSDRFIDAVARKLGDPSFDPHGDAIPDAHGLMPQRALTRLSDLPNAQVAVVARLTAVSDAMLQHILERGFGIDAQVEIISREPFEGPITTRVGHELRVVGYAVATCIWVEAHP